MKNLRLVFALIGLCMSSHAFAQFPIVLEAENAKLFGSLQVASGAGFSGGKYVNNFLITSDSYFLYDNVQIDQAGAYEFRAYTTGSSRPFSVKVNNYERTILWSNDSPDWNNPPTSVTSAVIYLDAGINVIKIANEMEHGPNMDKFEIRPASTVIDKPEIVKSVFPYSLINDATITAEHDNSTLPYLTDNDESTFYEVNGVGSTTITADCKENYVITSMLLSAGRGVAVSNWTMEYSTDGTNWKKLNFASYKLTGMGDLTLFTYTRTPQNAATYAARYYRLTATGTPDIKIAEWQLFGFPFADNTLNFPADITAETNPSSRASAAPTGNSGEDFTNLFDRKISTKYCAPGKVCYVQYVLDKAYKFSSYTVTSANDAPERDPKLWSFSGYNPEEGWIELDEQRDFYFPGRYTTMKFNINSDKEFTAFMFEVSSIKADNLENTLQFSKIQVFGEPTGNPAVEPAIPQNPSGDPKERAAELVQLMTKSEKLSYVGGIDWMFTKAIPRLGIPQMKMSDGPQGVGTWGESTAYPCAILLASTWNEDLAWSFGEALALDCRARGVNILLGPAVNIHRAPMCGRNFEYMGEDPYLASRTAVGYIKGLQDNGVMGVIKHFVANFQEYDRNNVSSDVDERTLNEIYFQTFRAAVEEAKVGAVMSSYNLLNGLWTSQNPWLLKTVLRDQWGFEGIVMSDWGATHYCLPAANGGLDLEMAEGDKMSPDSLRYYIDKGELDISTIDEKVQHILQTMIRFGFMDNIQQDNSIPADNPYCAQTALNVAREGIVLLKNQDNILPLKADKIKKVAVVGKNATFYMTGGGSGRVSPFHYVSFYDGIAALGLQKGIDVKYIDEYDHLDSVIFTEPGSNANGFKGEYFNNANLQGNLAGTRVDKTIDFNFQDGPGIGDISTSNYSIRWTGELRPEVSGTYTFTLGGDDGFRLYIDNVAVIDDWNAGSERYKTYQRTLTAGTDYNIKIEYFQLEGDAIVDFYWTRAGSDDYMLSSMNEADVVIACFGHNAGTEGEGSDRTFALPAKQSDLINKVLKTTKPVIGIVTAGGNVEMQSWEPQLKGLLWAWYPGQEGGTALGEILFGDVNPSGKLPVSFEKKWSDNPTYNSYYDTNKHVKFTEGVFMGYRGYDKLNRVVQYPFGYGLSYTTFNLSEMTVNETTENNSILEVSCVLKNTGNVAGAQVVQLYTGKLESSPVERPVKELKAYKKVYLEPGESETVTMYLPKEAFSYFDVNKTSFVTDEGLYEISLGFSSQELILKQDITIKNTTAVEPVAVKSVELIPSVVKAGELITITSGTASEIKVYDISGILKSHYKNTDMIPTAGFAQGLYVARIMINNKIASGKFVVK